MSITINQFDGQYSQDEINKMNAKVAEVLQALGFNEIGLSRKERDQIVAAVESEVSGNYDQDIGWPGSVDLIPAAWARLMDSRQNIPQD